MFHFQMTILLLFPGIFLNNFPVRDRSRVIQPIIFKVLVISALYLPKLTLSFSTSHTRLVKWMFTVAFIECINGQWSHARGIKYKEI